MPQENVPPDPRRVARRLACRVAAVLGPVLVVGVPVGAVAARPAPGGPAPASVAVAGDPAPVPLAEAAPPPGGRGNLVREECTVGAACTVTPPPGEDTEFTVTARGGRTPATLEAELDGGPAPDCTGYRERSGDWVRFGFTVPAAGATWSKDVMLTSRHPTTWSAARRQLQATEICFAAPYAFRTKRGFRLTGGPAGTADFQGVLGSCRPGRTNATLAQPCVHRRNVVHLADGWVTRITFRVPAGPLDPRGRS